MTGRSFHRDEIRHHMFHPDKKVNREIAMPVARRLVVLILISIAASLCCRAAEAQNYPTKPIRIFVGAGPDLVARVVAQKLTEAFGQQVVVEQVPGAGGIIAAQSVLKARPDGYTLLFSTATYMALEAFRPDISFDLSRDFEPIGKIGEGPAVLYANPSLGAKTLSDVLKIAKEKPGQINCASTGPGTQAHLGCEMLRAYGHADIVHVPYNGIGPALVDLLANRAQLLFGFAVSLPYVQEGKLVAICVSGPKRLSTAPDIPTAAEAGLPALDYTTWYGLHAPKGTPRPIIDKLNAALVTLLQDPIVKERILSVGFEAESSTPDAYGTFVKSELLKWRKIVKDTGAKPE
jgi:tripartite-type tricarboxylate transporter receptor subunit TctC